MKRCVSLLTFCRFFFKEETVTAAFLSKQILLPRVNNAVLLCIANQSEQKFRIVCQKSEKKSGEFY